MQTKIYNAYRITHKNGSVEDINAINPIQALENMDISETESKVQQLFLVKEDVKTLVADDPTVILFSTVVADGATGSIATPASGKVHVGDEIALRAIPARNYVFKGWKMNNQDISGTENLIYTIPDLGEIDTIVFTATFELAKVTWKSTVSPAEASGEGAVAFPVSGVVAANEELSLIAVNSSNYTFDHWERNGVNIGTNKILTTEVDPLAQNETEAVYTAVFTQA